MEYWWDINTRRSVCGAPEGLKTWEDSGITSHQQQQESFPTSPQCCRTRLQKNTSAHSWQAYNDVRQTYKMSFKRGFSRKARRLERRWTKPGAGEPVAGTRRDSIREDGVGHHRRARREMFGPPRLHTVNIISLEGNLRRQSNKWSLLEKLVTGSIGHSSCPRSSVLSSSFCWWNFSTRACICRSMLAELGRCRCVKYDHDTESSEITSKCFEK